MNVVLQELSGGAEFGCARYARDRGSRRNALGRAGRLPSTPRIPPTTRTAPSRSDEPQDAGALRTRPQPGNGGNFRFAIGWRLAMERRRASSSGSRHNHAGDGVYGRRGSATAAVLVSRFHIDMIVCGHDSRVPNLSTHTSINECLLVASREGEVSRASAKEPSLFLRALAIRSAKLVVVSSALLRARGQAGTRSMAGS